MPKQDFNSLLERYLSGQASAKEEQQLAVFFEQSGDQLKDARLSPRDKDRLFRDFSSSSRFRPQSGIRRKGLLVYLSPLRAWQSAAVWIIAVVSIFLLWQVQKSTQETGTAVVYKEISTERGKLLSVMLPDSTEIVLNANSTVQYHPDFAQHRQVLLTGEAWFKVHHDKAHPFIITTSDGLQTQVLGTEFTISSYATQPQTQVTVMEGRVQVKKFTSILGVLTRNKAIVYDRQSGKATEHILENTGESTGWIRGEWVYDGMDITDLQVLLDNYFGITVIAGSKKSGQLFTGANMNFNRRQTAEEIVSIFCMAANCRYEWKNKTTVKIFN